MDVDCMLRGMQGRVSFHMPGHKGRFGAGSGLDVTELPMTDDLHAPEGAYRALAERLRAVSGAGISFPLVGGSTRGVQLMLLCGAGCGSTVILPRNAHLSAWSACVLGGVSLAGGRATISGVIVGVLIMGTVENAMNLLNIDAFYQYLVRGMILLAAVTVDQLKNRNSGR